MKLSSNYDKHPVNKINGFDEHCHQGWDEIKNRIIEVISKKDHTLVAIECYQGLHHNELKENLDALPGVGLIDVSAIYKSPAEIRELVFPEVTDDAVFGRLTKLTINDFFDPRKLSELQQKIRNRQNDVMLLYGTGASQITDACDLLIYADMARWEIQQRMRLNQVDNLGVDNKHDPFNLKYKQAFFVDWRICDNIKIDLLDRLDYLLDTNIPGDPKLLSGTALRKGLRQLTHRPFRVVPFFDPGPWGGQWMREVCDLDTEPENFAWGFDCVPEENSLLLGFGNKTVEIPSLNLIFYQPEQVLGEEIYRCLGPEFPIRFDFLDTMDGGNLSLQVHPLAAYMREQFGFTYTQDESYYMLDAGEDAVVYLGLKEGVDPESMIKDLESAQRNEGPFEAEKHVETWQVKKHDHILIPAGTVHCSGNNGMVLEISATPYIFTFKLWDWGRMGLDGKPRPINIAHGEKVIDWDRTTEWIANNLIHQEQVITENETSKEEVTGLHESEFIETRRHWFTGPVHHDTRGTVNVLNLVEGREIIVESPTDSFDPFVVHYVETFIVPAAVGEYTIRPFGESEGQQCATLKAYVRPGNLQQLGNDLWMMKKLTEK